MTAEETLDEQAAADESSDRDADGDRNHLTGVEDGSGCTEIWEHLSERRGTESGEDESDEK
jgi:hypothetical protein